MQDLPEPGTNFPEDDEGMDLEEDVMGDEEEGEQAEDNDEEGAAGEEDEQELDEDSEEDEAIVLG
jgi:hypothetical protein